MMSWCSSRAGKFPQLGYRVLLPIRRAGGGARSALPSEFLLVYVRLLRPDRLPDLLDLPFSRDGPFDPMADVLVVLGVENGDGDGHPLAVLEKLVHDVVVLVPGENAHFQTGCFRHAGQHRHSPDNVSAPIFA